MTRYNLRHRIPIVALSAAILGSGTRAPAETPLGTAFTYQGELSQNSEPVSQNSDFQFSLWDESLGGNQVGVTLQRDDHPVAAGRFTALLDFGDAAFGEQARWLEIAVRSPAGGAGAFTTLSPRQELTPAPNALFSARPWQTNGDDIFFDGSRVGIGTNVPAYRLDVRAPGPRAIFGFTTNPIGTTYGILGQSASDAGVGVRGLASAISGQTTGVWGSAVGGGDGVRGSSPNGRGVFGEATDGRQDTAYGVYGVGAGESGIGVFGIHPDTGGDAPGVDGVTDSIEDEASGVRGRASVAHTGATTYGVLGISASQTGVGVHGESYIGVEGEGQQTGVSGTATNFGGVGVRGESSIGVEGAGEQTGVYGAATNFGGEGVRGEATFGVWGVGNNPASGIGAGVIGEAVSRTAVGVWGLGPGPGAPALRASNVDGIGIEVDDGCDIGIVTRGSQYALGAVTFEEDGVAATLSNTTGGLGLVVLGTTIMGTFSPLPEVPEGVVLAVDGKILAEELEVQLSQDWPDYVFADDYALPGLSQIEAFVREHGHLPGVPSAQEVARDGINVGAMQASLLRKVEELTLHVIELDKSLAVTRRDNQMLRERLASIEAQQ